MHRITIPAARAASRLAVFALAAVFASLAAIALDSADNTAKGQDEETTRAIFPEHPSTVGRLRYVTAQSLGSEREQPLLQDYYYKIDDTKVRPLVYFSEDVLFSSDGTVTITVWSGKQFDIILPLALVGFEYGRWPYNRFYGDIDDGSNQVAYTLSTDDGPLPDALEFNPTTRRLSGTVTRDSNRPRLYYRAQLAEEDETSRRSVLQVQIRIGSLTLSVPSLEYSPINVRQGQPIAPIVLPASRFGKEPVSHTIKPLPEGLEFNPDTRRLSGTPTGEVGRSHTLVYRANDASGRSERVEIELWINSPVPSGLRPAETTPELGTLDRNIIRRSAWTPRTSGRDEQGDYYYHPAIDEEWYTFHLDAPTELTIDLASDDADAELTIANRYYRETYDFEDEFDVRVRRVGYNDDSGAGTDAKLIVSLDAGYYTITAEHRGSIDEPSYYTLRISSPDFAPIVPTVPSAGRIVARRLDDGRTEFAWHVEGGDRILPSQRYLPHNPPTGRWLTSSDIVVEDVSIGRINVRVDASTGRIEFGFTPADGERILPRSRYLPANPDLNRWLRSTRIEWIE